MMCRVLDLSTVSSVEPSKCFSVAEYIYLPCTTLDDKMDEENVVAVTGLGCRFPGANDKVIFWTLLQNEENHIFYLKGYHTGLDFSYYTSGLVERFSNWYNQVFGIKDEEEKWVDHQQRFVLENGWDSFVKRSMVWTLLSTDLLKADSHESSCCFDYETYELYVYHPHDDKLLAVLEKLKSQPHDVCVVKMSVMQVILTADSQITILAVETASKSAVMRCDMTLNVLRTFYIRLEVKALRCMKKPAVSGREWAEYNVQDNFLCICWDIVSPVTEYVDIVHKICERDAFSYLATSSSDSIVYTSCWNGPNSPNTKARFCRKEFKYCNGDLPGPVAIYVESRGFICVCNRKPLTFHQLIGIKEPATVNKEGMPALVWAMYLMEKQREPCLKTWRRKDVWILHFVLSDQQETIQFAILTSVLHKAIIGFLSVIYTCCRKYVLSSEYHKFFLLALPWQCTTTDMTVCTRDVLVALSMAIVLMCIFVDYICLENIAMDEVTVVPSSCVIVFECNHSNIALQSRNLRETVHTLWINNNMIPSKNILSENILEYLVLSELHKQNVSLKLSHHSCMDTEIVLCSLKIDGRSSVDKLLTNERQINDVTTCDIITFCNFIPVKRSINNAKLDKLRAFFLRVVTYNSIIILETPVVRSQPLPSTSQLTQRRLEGNVFRLVSSKQKIRGKESKKMQTKNMNLKAVEINSKMFTRYSVVVRDEPLDRRGNEKHDIHTSHALAYLDGTKLQLQNASVNLSEGSREKVDLQRRKKCNLIQMLLPHLEELPQPHVHREVIVGFLSGEYSKSPEDATCSPTEHEDLREILKRLASDEILEPQITMKFEALRLCTLKNYPRENKPFAVRLVAAGFYYAGHRDQLICYCCAIRKDNWVGGDIPILIHRKMSPGCSFLTNNVSANIPMKRYTSAGSTSVRLLAIQRFHGSNQSDVAESESSLLLPSCEQTSFKISNTPKQMLATNNDSTLTQLNASEGPTVLDNRQTITANTDSVGEPPPMYPQYAARSARINSFQSWPEEHRQRPEEMAECGFYYAGFSDCVRCFYCGVGLRHWMSEDDPWIEHARWSTSCRYVLKMKGEEFVSLVKMAVEIAEREADRKSRGENQASPNNQREVTATAETEDTTGSRTTEGAVGDATSSASSSGNTDIQKYLLTDAAQSVLDMGYQPKMVLRSIERVLMKKGSEQLTAQIIMEAVLDIEEEEVGKNQPPPLTPGIGQNNDGATKGVYETEVGAMGSEHSANQETDPEMICKVCLDNTISVVFLPCGHLVTCADCAPAMRKCPICRTLIKGTVKIFFG